MNKKQKNNRQFLELSREIYNFKKLLVIDDEELLKNKIKADLTKICMKNGNLLFSKTEILELLPNSTPNKIDYTVSENNLNICKIKGHKTIIKFQTFLEYFIIPDIIDTIKTKNL